MKAINCPQCGAPANIQDTQQAVYTCPFCNRSFDTGNARAEEKDDAPIPQIIVVAPGDGGSRSSGGGGGTAIIGTIVMFACIGGFTYFMLRSAGVPMKDVKETFVGPTWDGKSALECSGNAELTFENIDATLSGTAIITSGNCHVKLVNCHVKADTVMELNGNSQIRLEGGSYEGETAIDASGNSVVRIAGATVTGKRKHKANARIDGK